MDAVLDKVTGVLVNGSNADEIAEKICELLANPQTAKQMGQAGRGWVIENWQLSRWSKKFNQLLIGD